MSEELWTVYPSCASGQGAGPREECDKAAIQPSAPGPVRGQCLAAVPRLLARESQGTTIILDVAPTFALHDVDLLYFLGDADLVRRKASSPLLRAPLIATGRFLSKPELNSQSSPPPHRRRAFFYAGTPMELNFDKLGGLLPAVIQDARSGRVLMVGFMNEEAFRRTVESGYVTFYSRSRNKLWTKGETSGHRLLVQEIQTDCDRDALLVKVELTGPGVCHEGYASCFFRTWRNGQWETTEPRAFDPDTVYGR